MALASSVLGFEIVELWTEEGDGNLHCTYVHASDAIVKKYPEVIAGHYPNHKKEHKLSPVLCNLAKESNSRYHWRVVDDTADGDYGRSRSDSQGQVSSYKNLEGINLEEASQLHPDLKAPVKTEMSYMLYQVETGNVRVFIVGFAIDRIEYKPQKLKFLSGLGYAIYVAAFDLDAESDDDDDAESAVLDQKEFLPRPLTTTFASGIDLANMDKKGSNEELGMGVWGSQHMTELKLSDYQSTVPPLPSNVSSTESFDLAKDIVEVQPATLSEGSKSNPIHKSNSQTSLIVEEAMRLNPSPFLVVSDLLNSPGGNPLGNLKKNPDTPIPMALSMPPTWDPVDEFSYPVAEIPISSLVPDNLLLEHFDDVQHIADGSNANIFLAKLNGERVIIKMIKSDVQTDPVAVHEFDVEHGMLSRISHPNVIKLLGAGRSPRRFVVLEWLGGGSLNTILSQNQAKPGLAQKLFRRPTFTYANLLSKARDMAEALDFLHSRCHPGATIIHRDLKPDNVGFTNSGTLKLFDFGLCTCVRRRKHLNEAYELTGNTGSLRYMAPEVALRQPYTEKADVYSFGIMVWQMARDRVPFKGLSREDFMTHVVTAGQRPKLDKSWPSGFSNLLTASWHKDSQSRPSFQAIVAQLGKLMEDQGVKTWPKRGRALGGGADDQKESASTWF
eukprot:CAMPEP_0119047376 /NCGR_PEP_ID=MMETSP1177-20130426/52811_1 /TAXON_ID=2985 /ORGANISM="Ochromonas sp, Strain CCMP1899" /LENGTH=669 /DNA_ID=CAMNT_0007021909 /DNA_START=346 /DNA_END=2355 /DNA_ORIENTATION=-